MNRHVLTILIFLFSVKAGGAQVFDENSFVRYTVKDGLCQNNITCLQQDEWGYLWVGTDNGLSRFDGNSFNNYSASSPTLPLLSVKLARLKAFGKHQLGILSHSGLQVLNTANFLLKNYLVPDSTAFITYRNIAWDAEQLPQQGFALTTAAGFYVFDSTGKLNLRHDAYRLEDVGNKRILYGRDIFTLSNSEYLVYAEEDKLAIYNSTKKEFNEINSPQGKWRGFYSPATPGNQLLGSKYALNNHEFIFINNQLDSIVYYDHRRHSTVLSPLPFHCLQELNWNSK
ncbi:MAG: two-component regulator propeller domain-containing protein, partial [Bacteroidota bacterium]